VLKAEAEGWSVLKAREAGVLTSEALEEGVACSYITELEGPPAT
jgi:hypothetical protein